MASDAARAGAKMCRAAVAGKPVGHSLSPVIHNSGYAAAGLRDWRYIAIECADTELPDLVASLGPEWVGLSLTMPLKEVGIAVADTVSPLAGALGAANTLVRRDGRWHADNTDAPGMVDALRAAGVSSVDGIAVLGAGGTARAALAAAADFGAAVTVYARRPAAVDALRPVADRLGIVLHAGSWADAAGAAAADVVISTVPKGVADELASVRWRPDGVVFDAIYDPWPTPLAAAAQAAGAAIVSGLDLLLAQAVHQFVVFTGVAAPVEQMRAALMAAAAARQG